MITLEEFYLKKIVGLEFWVCDEMKTVNIKQCAVTHSYAALLIDIRIKNITFTNNDIIDDVWTE